MAQSDSLATDTVTYIPFVAYWEQGEQYRYEVEKYDLRYTNDSLVKADTTKYTAMFEVLDSTATSYRIRWKFEEYQSSKAVAETLAEAPEEMQAAISQLEFEEIIFSTDEYGTFQQIENLEQIQAVMQLYINQFKEEAKAEYGQDAMQWQKIAKTLDITFNAMQTRSYIESNMFVELIHLLNPLGAEFPAFDTLRYRDEFPNNFGGDPIGASGEYFFDTLIVDEYYGHLKQYVDLDEVDTKRAINDYFVQTGLEGDALVKLLENSKYLIFDDNDFMYYYDPGIPIFVDCMRTISFKIEASDSKVIKRYLLSWVD